MTPRRVLALAQLTNSFGDGAYYVTSALYFSRIVGLSAGEIGIGLTAAWAVGALAGMPLGHLADRYGPRRMAVALALVTAASVGFFLLARSFWAFLAVACVYATAQTGLSAARQALLAALVPPAERTRVRAVLQSTSNAGLAVGAAMGGLALHAGTREAFLAVLAMDCASFVIAALVLTRAPSVRGVRGEPRMEVLRDRRYAVVTLVHAVMLLNLPLLSLVIPLWIVQNTTAPAWMVSALLVLNTVSVVLFQVRIARRVNGLGSASLAVRHAGFVMLAACVVFGLSAFGATALFLLLGGALQVFGEMLLASGAWEISFGLAPEGKHGQYQGFFGSGLAVARMLGPALLTWLVLGGGMAGWVALGVVFAASGVLMRRAVKFHDKTIDERNFQDYVHDRTGALPPTRTRSER
ncbi:MFS transporter [Nonomuraea soli]|uniref:MFS family permease n=1 Tax=Nonomuraea soli TaxID=1032476 RepID=A0A7W0CIK8_9ACTN|nr:MFS transporter [Nonomuraea soli]MBA2891719.1 MFS family permease [Nonomuraea soli]